MAIRAVRGSESQIRPESKRIHPDASRSHSFQKIQWLKMLAEQIRDSRIPLVFQALTRFVPAKAGIQRLSGLQWIPVSRFREDMFSRA